MIPAIFCWDKQSQQYSINALQKMLAKAFYQEPFEKFFSLQEAESLLPHTLETLSQAQAELTHLQEQVILQGRIIDLMPNSKSKHFEQELSRLNKLQERVDELHSKWLQHFGNQGIILQDLERGKLAFPYRHCKVKGKTGILWWTLTPSNDLSLAFAGFDMNL